MRKTGHTSKYVVWSQQCHRTFLYSICAQHSSRSYVHYYSTDCYIDPANRFLLLGGKKIVACCQVPAPLGRPGPRLPTQVPEPLLCEEQCRLSSSHRRVRLYSSRWFAWQHEWTYIRATNCEQWNHPCNCGSVHWGPSGERRSRRTDPKGLYSRETPIARSRQFACSGLIPVI